MHLEKFIYDRLGVRKEYPQTNLLVLSALVGFANVYSHLTGLQISGDAPEYGPLIVISNHIDYFDPFRMLRVGIRARSETARLGRVARAVAKSTLFGLDESVLIKERTGKKDWLNSNHPLIRFLIRNCVGGPLLSTGAIPINRGTTDLTAIRQIDRALSLNEAVAICIIDSRDSSGGLKGLQKGPAFLLRHHPDIPYCLVGISKDPHAVNISKPSTYAELKRERGSIGINELTMLLADGIIELQSERIQEAWKTKGREKERQRLTPDPS